jgi:hypothetical protein
MNLKDYFSEFFVKYLSNYFTRKNEKLCLTLEGKNARAGYLFALPFIIGFTFFMLLPLLESFRMVFSKVTIDRSEERRVGKECQ